MHPVVLPILEANMTHGVVRAWLKRVGDTVQAGEPLFEIETDKVNAEVEAVASGVLRHIAAPVGARVPVLGILAFIGTAEEVVPPPETWGTLVPQAAVGGAAEAQGLPLWKRGIKGDCACGTDERAKKIPPSPPFSEGGADRTAASPAARRLARERGIALESIQASGPRGEVTRADVEAVAPPASAGGSGQIDPAFLAELRRDADALRALSSETKVQCYRDHGAQLGEHVRIEPGAIIIAAHIRIGAGASIGADSIIECERLELGRLAAFGRRTRVHCRSVAIGDALWSKDDVVIGGGGSEEPGARLRAGAACFFGEGAYLNTCHPLTLGDEVCIGARAMLFTHSHWQSILRGYSSVFAPIQIGDHVFIGNNAFVFPGVTIGAGATVMVNSFVALNVPPDTFVGGVPAQVIRHITPPSRDEQVALVRERLMPELADALTERGYGVTHRDADLGVILDLGPHGVVQFAASAALDTIETSQRAVVLAFTDEVEPSLAPQVTLFDLAGSRVLGMQDALSDEVRELCRRRGIRLRPYAWRYGVGHVAGERLVRRQR